MDYVNKIENDHYSINYNEYINNFLNQLNINTFIDNNKIIFKAESVVGLHHIDLAKIEKFIYDLMEQIILLKGVNKGILFFSLSDILVLNGKNFVFVNENKIYDLLDDRINLFKLSNYKNLQFISPEIENIKRFPAKIYFTCSYYSLALLILYVFKIKLENLYFSSPYYFLIRCLHKIPQERYLIYC